MDFRFLQLAPRAYTAIARLGGNRKDLLDGGVGFYLFTLRELLVSLVHQAFCKFSVKQGLMPAAGFLRLCPQLVHRFLVFAMEGCRQSEYNQD